jgi:hypothetical protein
MITTVPSATRRWAGALCLLLAFVALIGATLADPLDDDASGAAQVRAAVAHLGALRATFLLELLAALLFLGATMAVVGAVRGRGSAVANAGGVLGVLGGAGLAMICVGHVFLYALAASGTPDAARVLAARDHAAGPLPLLFFAAPFAVVVLAVAAHRAGLAPWPVLVVAGVFLVLEFVPTPGGEIPALVAGLATFGWLAGGLLSATRSGVGGAREPAASDSTTVRA